MKLNILDIPITDLDNPNLHWLIDLDNTIYMPVQSLMSIIEKRIQYYISYKCRCSLVEAEVIRIKLYKKYNHCFIGALREKIILKSELSEFLNYCHNFDISDELVPNAELLNLLDKIQGEKYVFTNTVSRFAQQILQNLSLCDIFKKVYCLEDLAFNFKPNPVAFRIVLDEMNVYPENAILIDDDSKNIDVALSLNMKAFYPHYTLNKHV